AWHISIFTGRCGYLDAYVLRLLAKSAPPQQRTGKCTLPLKIGDNGYSRIYFEYARRSGGGSAEERHHFTHFTKVR
ncbi:MAG: hypothetical protein ACE5D4_09105, partial [Thermodesulfobacteriota bacterium]